MDVPDRWVLFALLNWTDAEGGASAEVRGPAIAAARTIFTLVRDRFRPWRDASRSLPYGVAANFR